MNTFEFLPKGPFDLLYQNQFFGGWPTLPDDATAIVITFPVEEWKSSAAVVLRQETDSKIVGHVYGTDTEQAQAWKQALAALSLDVDGSQWPEVGKHDQCIGRLQETYQYLRPILFHSPYEAAVSFIAGHRISIKQARAIRQRMAEEYGDTITIDTTSFHAFPRPQELLKISEFKSLSQEKMRKLHSTAQAAIDGLLNRDYLRSLPLEEALTQVDALPGIGAFFAQGIVLRGAGIVDDVTNDDNSKYAIQLAYHLPHIPNQQEVLRIAESWKPYRMWAEVLLHMWVRREAGGFGKVLDKNRQGR